MFLFLIGIGLPELIVFILLLAVFGLLIAWLTKILLRKILKNSPDRKIKLISQLCGFVLSPALVICSVALFVYLSTQNAPRESEEDMLRSHYEMIEEKISDDLEVGMSKTKVVQLFGDADTTESVLTYDLSTPQAKEKYILEIEFDSNGLKDFKRQR